MALPCMDSDGPKPKTGYDADADDDTDVPSPVDVTMHDAPAVTKKARPAGGAGSKAGGRTAAKGGGKRSASSSVRGGVQGGSNKKTTVAATMSRTGTRPSSPFVKAEPGLTPSSSGGHEDSDSQEENRAAPTPHQAGGGGDDPDDPDDPDDDDDDDDPGDDSASDNGPYCICRGPDDHRWMIQCDNCEDWFHGDCVQLDKEESENLIVSYICPNCAVPDLYVTRFRKLCALPGCRKPARLYAAADSPAEGPAAASPTDASAFCSDAHRDQWWEVLLERMAGEAAPTEDKMPVDQLTPAQLVAVLMHSNEPGVAQMLLHGLAQDSSSVHSDALLSAEERTITDASAAERYRLAAQVAMCKKMLLLLDMAKTRNQEATKAGYLERDGCGYDERLEHVGVQPHFARFLSSPEGQAIFHRAAAAAGESGVANGHRRARSRGSGSESDSESDSEITGGRRMTKRRLGPPRFDEAGQPVGAAEGAAADATAAATATAGMCRKRKCRAHAGWFLTLARDVRLQIQECTRQAAALRDKETRIRQAAVQRAFVMQHSTSEVRRFSADAWSDDEDDAGLGDRASSLSTSHGTAPSPTLNGHGARWRQGTDSS